MAENVWPDSGCILGILSGGSFPQSAVCAHCMISSAVASSLSLPPPNMTSLNIVPLYTLNPNPEVVPF